MKELYRNKDILWGRNFGIDHKLLPEQEQGLVEDLINQSVQKYEFEIFAASDWNFNQGNGSEILSSLLKFANKDYDFSRLLTPANT